MTELGYSVLFLSYFSSNCWELTHLKKQKGFETLNANPNQLGWLVGCYVGRSVLDVHSINTKLPLGKAFCIQGLLWEFVLFLQVPGLLGLGWVWVCWVVLCSSWSPLCVSVLLRWSCRVSLTQPAAQLFPCWAHQKMNVSAAPADQEWKAGCQSVHTGSVEGMWRSTARDCCPRAREGFCVPAHSLCSPCPAYSEPHKAPAHRAFSSALSESDWHPASGKRIFFACCGPALIQYTLQLLLCLTCFLFSHLFFLTQSDQQSQEDLAVCVSSGAASCSPHFHFCFKSDVLCPTHHITSLLFLLA